MVEDVTEGLIVAILENLDESAPADWQALAMVIEATGRRVDGTYGYLYLADGSSFPTSCWPALIRPAAHAYLDSHYAADDPWPVKFLVQFDVGSGEYEVTFEDTDRSRWKPNLSNVDELPEALRPNFDDGE